MDRYDVDWQGYIPAITTPFTKEGHLDFAALATQLEWLLAEGMHGIILAGTTGEWYSLSGSERSELFARAAQVVAGRVPLIGGCNAFTAAEASAHAEAAAVAGLDGILLTPPPYVVPTPAETVAFYRRVHDSSTLPICVYNWPRGCVIDLDVPTLAEICELERVVAVKNSTGDFRSFLSGLYELGEKIRYFGLPTTALTADLFAIGRADGLMGSGGVLGSAHPGFWDALAAGDADRALKLGRMDQVLMSEWFLTDYGARFGNAPAIMKTALRMQGVPAGYVRDPLIDLNAAEADNVRATLSSLGIETPAA